MATDNPTTLPIPSIETLTEFGNVRQGNPDAPFRDVIYGLLESKNRALHGTEGAEELRRLVDELEDTLTHSQNEIDELHEKAKDYSRLLEEMSGKRSCAESDLANALKAIDKLEHENKGLRNALDDPESDGYSSVH